MQWVKDVIELCQLYNVPVSSLAEILRDPKVIPMIRGKAFEFHVAQSLKAFFPACTWKIDKPFINPQLEIHDSDVRITHIKTGRVFSVECKLAGKGSYKYLEKQELNVFRVKCMRSRTLGEVKVKQLAPKYGLSEEVLKTHNDQYLPTDFSAVVTSIGNAFYETDAQSGAFIWQPSKRGEKFLLDLQAMYGDFTPLKDFAFSRMYIAKSLDLSVSPDTQVVCTRKKCNEKTSCGFIPNYPTIEFWDGNKSPIARWLPIEESLTLFQDMI
jgi:hypothetical protein